MLEENTPKSDWVEIYIVRENMDGDLAFKFARGIISEMTAPNNCLIMPLKISCMPLYRW